MSAADEGVELSKGLLPSQDQYGYEIRGNDVFFRIDRNWENARALLEIPQNEADLMEALSDQPGLMAWIGVLSADAEADAVDAKKVLETTDADLEGWYRDKFAKNGTKVTDKAVDAAIRNDTEHQDALATHLLMMRRAGVLKALYEGVRGRGVLIAALAGMVRDERRAMMQASARD